MEMSKSLPYPLIYKVTAMFNAQISNIIKEANCDDSCTGIITRCHTSKIWLNGPANQQKPYCHLATQYNLEIPNDEIDMDFMNLNQAPGTVKRKKKNGIKPAIDTIEWE